MITKTLYKLKGLNMRWFVQHLPNLLFFLCYFLLDPSYAAPFSFDYESSLSSLVAHQPSRAMWSSEKKKRQIDNYLELQEKYGADLGNYERHISELGHLLPEIERLIHESPFYKETVSKRENVDYLIAEVGALRDEGRLSFPRFKMYLCALEILASRQEWSSESEKTPLTNRSNRIWYFDHLRPLFDQAKGSISIEGLEERIKGMEKTYTAFKKDRERVYKNLLVSFIESPSSIPIVGKTPYFGYVDANYAILNGLHPYGVTFNASSVHNGFHTEPIDIFFHDLIHIEYINDVTSIFRRIKYKKAPEEDFFQLIQQSFLESFREDGISFCRTQYSLFLLLHDPDPVQFNKLFEGILKHKERSYAEGRSAEYCFINSCLQSIVREVMEFTLHKYYVTEGADFTPNEIRVAVYDVLKTLEALGLPVNRDLLEKVTPTYPLSTLHFTQIKQHIENLIDILLLKGFFSKEIFNQEFRI